MGAVMLPYFYIFILIHILFMGVLIMNKDKINQMFDEMLEESAKACKAEVMEEEEEVTEEEKEEAKKSAKEVLENFLSYIKSARFNNKIESVAKEYKLPKQIVKNHFDNFEIAEASLEIISSKHIDKMPLSLYTGLTLILMSMLETGNGSSSSEASAAFAALLDNRLFKICFSACVCCKLSPPSKSVAVMSFCSLASSGFPS